MSAAIDDRPSDRSVLTREQLRERVGRMVTVRPGLVGWFVYQADRVLDSRMDRQAVLRIRDEVISSIMAALWPEGDA